MFSPQDTLRLLTLWFRDGARLSAVVERATAPLGVGPWLEVLPQLIARIDHRARAVRASLRALLARVARAHPQALIYPVTVATGAPRGSLRRAAADALARVLRESAPRLAAEAALVAREMQRAAITWHERWFQAFEDAANALFGDEVRRPENVLAPLPPCPPLALVASLLLSRPRNVAPRAL